jgi:hypothetical protein
VAQSADAPKTSIMNGLAFRDLCGIDREEDSTSLLENLHSFQGLDVSPSDPSKSHIRETPDSVNGSSQVAQQKQEVGAAIHDDERKYSLQHMSVPSLPKSCFVLSTV